MFERFTDRNRRVVVLAQEYARQLQHNYIGTEHLLLGILDEGESLAARALHGLGLDVAAVRAKVVELVGEGAQPPQGHIPFSPGATKALDRSLREALQHGHNYIGPEHLLLALARELRIDEGNTAARVLAELQFSCRIVRHVVNEQMKAYGADERRRNDPYLTTTAARGATQNAGVWMAFNHDGSMARPFAAEVEALRYAIANGCQVEFTPWGQDVGAGEKAS